MLSCPKYSLAESTQKAEQREVKRHISKAEPLSSMDKAQIFHNEGGGGKEILK